MLDQQTKGRKASIVNGRKSAVKGQLMTYGRMFRFPETHKSQPDVCKMGESRFFVCGGDESRRPEPGPRERRSDCKRCNVLCAPRRKKRKVAIFHSEIQFLKTPESMCRCFHSNSIALRRKRERKCFFNVDDADFSGLKGNFRCTYEAVVVVLKVSFDLHLLEIQKAPFGMCLSY